MVFVMTLAGDKVHVERPGTGMTLCGLEAVRFVLAEWPLSRQAMCEWCRARVEGE